MSDVRMLVTDLDGTLLGDADALQRFQAWRLDRGPQTLLVYASGRTCADVSRLVLRGDLPAPDFTIGALGTELCDSATGSLAMVGPRFGSSEWNAHQVTRILTQACGLELQPREFQSQYKVSCFLDAATPAQLTAISAALTDTRVECEVSYSGGRFLDVLPAGVSKGASARMLARQFQLPAPCVVACGDSGNDTSLFVQGFRGVLVANAEEALVTAVGEGAYWSPYAYADGVLDGLQYWARENAASAASAARPAPHS